jgi:diguanylate cyclase (GGDEF)-like protein
LPFARHAQPAAAAPQPRPAPASVPAPVPHAAIEAIGASYQGVFEIVFPSGEVILSREAASLLGLPAGRLAKAEWLERIHPDDRGTYEQALDDFGAQAGVAFRIEFRARAEDGRYPWFELRATMKGKDGAPAERCVGLIADVTVRKESEAAAMERDLRDPLTGLGNRVALMEELEKLGEKLRDVTFAMLDIDRFKTIHSSLGDQGGDDVLASLAQRLTRRFTGLSQVFRVGGDAFAVLARGKPDEVGEELVSVCGGAHLLNGRNVFAPASVGVAEGAGARDPIDLLKNAELALIQAKRQGGDCARVYTRELESLAPADTVALEAALRRALEENQIEVFYQPIVRLSDRSVAGFEALLRWRHPSKGLVSPGDFIAHSEETGLIVALGKLALKRASTDLAQWQRFFPLAPPLFASVNLSRRQFSDPGLEDVLKEHLNGMAPGTLKLEITESAIASDIDAPALMTRLKALGAGLAIDDFGTGLSSLSQLKDLPFDTVKIDKSFLSRHGGSDAASDSEVVLASVVALARDLKRSLIVEGVETESDAARLADLGCEFAQGFLFSEPLTPKDALTYIARHYRVGKSGASGVGG